MGPKSSSTGHVELLREWDVASRNLEVEPPNLQLLMSGDDDEWAKAFKWLRPLAIGVADRILTGYPADVEDVVSDSLYKLRSRVPEIAPSKIDELRALTSWITKCEAINFIRKKKALKNPKEIPFRFDKETGTPIEPPSRDNQIERLSERDLIRLIDYLAKKLTPLEFDVFKCKIRLGLKNREISQKLGIPMGSVGVHWMNVQKKLRKWLSDLGEDFFEN